MHVTKSNVLILFFLAIIAGLLTVSCSDDDKPTASDPQWRWAAFGTEDFFGGASALTVYDNKLIAAGWGISAWDGSSWEILVSNGGADALAVYDNKLIAAGMFTSLYTETGEEINANNIASWDGTAWSTLGTGTDADIWGLTVWNNKLIACGNFDSAGGVSAPGIAAWDGSSWDSLGAGWNETVSELIVYDGQLYAGAGTRLIVWNGTSWTFVPDGPVIQQGGSTTALAVYGDKLIRGGASQMNFTEQMYISAWDGSSWTTLGTGTDYWVYDLAVFDNKLIAAGGFSTAGGVDVNYIAAWNDTSWTALGTGMNDIVFALEVWNNKLIAGGNFDSVGGISAYGIAAWGLQ